MDITSYDSTGGSTVVPSSAADDGTVVFANAFDGIVGAGITAPPTTIFGASNSESLTSRFGTVKTTTSSVSIPTTSSKSSSSIANGLAGSTAQAMSLVHAETSNLRIVLVLVLSLMFGY